jgi:hypothetical protein
MGGFGCDIQIFFENPLEIDGTALRPSQIAKKAPPTIIRWEDRTNPVEINQIT